MSIKGIYIKASGMINYNAYTTKQEILDIAILNARIRNIGMLTAKEPQIKKMVSTQSQFDSLYNNLLNQLLRTMQVTSADMTYNNPSCFK